MPELVRGRLPDRSEPGRPQRSRKGGGPAVKAARPALKAAVQVLNPSVLTWQWGRVMTRQWRKQKQSDFAKPSFSFDQCTLLNPDFSYALPRRSPPVWGSHVFFF